MSASQNDGVQTRLAQSRMRATVALMYAMVFVIIVLAACTVNKSTPSSEDKTQSALPELAIFTLSEGKRPLPEREKVAQNATSLSETDRSRLLSRVPEPKQGETTAFKLPEETLQPLPPKSGTTEKSVFPPPSTDEKAPAKPQVKVEPLKILRHVPDGDVDKDTAISITFSQPMVPISTVGQVASASIPVKLTPAPKGEWRWLGTQTLTFVADKSGLPGSTEFKVEIPAGITSSTNGKLESGLQWSFSTPTNTIREFYPYGDYRRGVSRDPVMLMVFSQPVEPQEVLKSIEMHHSLGIDKPLHLVTEQEVLKDTALKNVIEKPEAKNWIAFKADTSFQGPDNINIVLPQGSLGSTEGPLKSRRPFSYNFSTYGPLKVTGHNAYNGRPKQLTLSLSNELKTQGITEKSFAVEPPVANLKLGYCYNSSLQLVGAFKSRTHYKVRINGVEDIYGQKLEKNTVEVDFGKPEPSLEGGYGQLLTLERSDKNNIYTIVSSGHSKLNVSVYAAHPQNFSKYTESYYEKAPKGAELLWKNTVAVDPWIDDLQTDISLDRFLKNGYGQIIVAVNTKDKDYEHQSMVWLQFTNLGVDAFSDGQDIVAWVTDLHSGSPLKGVSVVNGAASAHTDDTGLARMPAVPSAQILCARKGDDLCILPNYFEKQVRPEGAVWYCQTDRGLYKPGETVKAKGWLRKRKRGPKARLDLLPPAGLEVTYTAHDSRGNDLAKGKSVVDAQGGFVLDFKIPKNANLGQSYVTVHLQRNGHEDPVLENHETTVSYDIQEFRRPEFEMKVTDLKPRSLLLGETATLQASAHYYAGGALSETPIKWEVNATPGMFTPQGWEEYQFGGGNYEFLHEKELHVGDGFPAANYTQPSYVWPISMFDITNARLTKWLDGKQTDFNGEHVLDVHVSQLAQAVPLSFQVTGTVEDKNHQAWTDKSTLLFHPANVYVGLKNNSYFVEEGKPLSLSAIVTDLDGKLVKGKSVELDMFREKSVARNGKTVPERKSIGHKSITSAAEPVILKVDPTKDEGDYIVVATVHDDDNHASKTELRIWCMGAWSSFAGLQQSSARLMADKKEYAPGETASVMVMSPFAPFHGLLNVKREGFVKTIRFDSNNSSCSVNIPLDEDCVPQVQVEVDLVGNKPDAAVSLDNTNPVKTKPTAEGPTSKVASIDNTIPAFATGTVTLAVPPKHHAMTLSVQPVDASLNPGGETSIKLQLKDLSGKPMANGQVAVIVVDESILALNGYRLQTPLDSFYTNSDPGVSEVYGRNSVFIGYREYDEVNGNVRIRRKCARHSESAGFYGYLARGGGGGYAPVLQGATNGSVAPQGADATVVSGIVPPPMPCASPAPCLSGKPGASYGKKEIDKFDDALEQQQKQPLISLRTNFEALAAFVPLVTTDSQGNGSIKVKMPDSLTRYRVMAVAAAGKGEFAKGESSITARLPLMVKPSFPRFLRFGDITELPVMIHNQTDKAMTVDVALRGSGIELMDNGKRITVGPNDRVEVRFKANANQAGTPTLQVVASSGALSDASEQSFPVYTPATTEAFATYGQIDDSRAVLQPVEKPKDAFTQFGDLEVTTSSTALQSLVDAYHYLEDYDYACSEQLSSRLLTMLALKDVMAAFKSQSPADRLKTANLMRDDLRTLLSRQRSNGDFGLWKKEDETDWPYVSIQVTRALIVAKQKGMSVPPDAFERALSYLRNIEHTLRRDQYSKEAILTLQAYAQYVLNMAGQAQLPEARMLLTEGLEYLKPGEARYNHQWWHNGVTDNLESAGWLVCILNKDTTSAKLVAKTKKLLESRIDETASTADVLGGSYGEYNYRMFYCPKRLNAVVLEALMINDPKNPVIPKLVNGLLGDRHQGKWESTQEDFHVLLALDRYFNTYEKTTPEFRVNMWLGKSFAGKQEYHGRSTVSKSMTVPMSYLVKEDKQDVTLQKDGAGRLYYRIGMRYAPKNLSLGAMDRGFVVKRTYEAVDRKEDVRHEKDGTWHIAPGATVKVVLEMEAPSTRFHVALNDPLPAGLEITNPNLKGNKQTNDSGATQWWWNWNWYEHQNLKDDRAEAFSSVIWGGKYQYSYFARATTPGTFQVPPTKAEEMYAPETFGRCASDLVIVE